MAPLNESSGSASLEALPKSLLMPCAFEACARQPLRESEANAPTCGHVGAHKVAEVCAVLTCGYGVCVGPVEESWIALLQMLPEGPVLEVAINAACWLIESYHRHKAGHEACPQLAYLQLAALAIRCTKSEDTAARVKTAITTGTNADAVIME